MISLDKKLEAQQRMLAEQQEILDRRCSDLQRIALVLEPLIHQRRASDEVIQAYAIAKESR